MCADFSEAGQKVGSPPDDEYHGQISSIQHIFAQYDHEGSGKVRVERVPDLIANLGRDLQLGREVARQLSAGGAVELVTFEEVVQKLKKVEEFSGPADPDGETTTPLTLLKRLHTYRKQCESLKTSGSDIFAQKYIEGREEIDFRRNLVFLTWGLLYLGGVQYFLYVHLFTRRLFPTASAFAAKPLREKIADTAGQGIVLQQVFVDQFVHHPFFLFPAFYQVKEFIE
ncbi:unnamed protein product, partial [Polarella glacialis]